MKKICLLLSAMLLIGAVQSVKAQRSYTTAGGISIDFGNGATFVGPSVKHFFNSKDAIQGMLLFGNGVTILGAEYSYNEAIRNAGGLMWNIGVGPQMAFGDGYSDFLIRPALGLEYTVPDAPINFGFDWRPMWQLTHGSNFEAGRFGIAFRYVFH